MKLRTKIEICIVYLVTIMIGGCAAKRPIRASAPQQINARLPVVSPTGQKCLWGWIDLQDCDFTKQVPCKVEDASHLQYDPACIQIIVKEKK